MRIPVDENIPVMTVRQVRDLGHDVLDIRGTGPEGRTTSVYGGLLRSNNDS